MQSINESIKVAEISLFLFLQRKPFFIPLIKYKGYVELGEKNGDLIIEGGVCGDIVKILCNKLNFT